MPSLYMITVSGLEVKLDWRPVHDRLLDEFPRVTDVLATTIPETVLIVYEGRADVDAWLQTLNDAVFCRRMRARAMPRSDRRQGRAVGPRGARRRSAHTTFSVQQRSNAGGIQHD